jgi:two-component system, cell cycle response regulator
MKNSVLIIDDSDQIRQEVHTRLQEARLFDAYHEAKDGIDGFKIMLNKPVDLVLCDVVMPGIDGFKFLSMKKARPEFDDIPVIMLTGEDDVKLKIKALEQGASDYITKPFNPGELVARVRVHYKIKQLQEELRETNRRLEELSNTDGLTKLYNRRYFMELFELEFQRAQRYEAKLGFVMIDIDNFKSFNDTYGHLIGDRILYEVSQILRETLRVHDIVGRYGGEEFALLMPETGAKGALVVAERYRKRVEEFVLVEDNKDLRLTITLGVAAYPDPRMHSIGDLIRLADNALFQAKKNGRNRVEIAEGQG